MFPDLDPDDNVLLDIPPAETAAATRKTKKNVKLTLTLWSKDDISFVCINTQPHVKRFKQIVATLHGVGLRGETSFLYNKRDCLLFEGRVSKFGYVLTEREANSVAFGLHRTKQFHILIRFHFLRYLIVQHGLTEQKWQRCGKHLLSIFFEKKICYGRLSCYHELPKNFSAYLGCCAQCNIFWNPNAPTRTRICHRCKKKAIKCMEQDIEWKKTTIRLFKITVKTSLFMQFLCSCKELGVPVSCKHKFVNTTMPLDTLGSSSEKLQSGEMERMCRILYLLKRSYGPNHQQQAALSFVTRDGNLCNLVEHELAVFNVLDGIILEIEKDAEKSESSTGTESTESTDSGGSGSTNSGSTNSGSGSANDSGSESESSGDGSEEMKAGDSAKRSCPSPEKPPPKKVKGIYHKGYRAAPPKRDGCEASSEASSPEDLPRESIDSDDFDPEDPQDDRDDVAEGFDIEDKGRVRRRSSKAERDRKGIITHQAPLVFREYKEAAEQRHVAVKVKKKVWVQVIVCSFLMYGMDLYLPRQNPLSDVELLIGFFLSFFLIVHMLSFSPSYISTVLTIVCVNWVRTTKFAFVPAEIYCVVAIQMLCLEKKYVMTVPVLGFLAYSYFTGKSWLILAKYSVTCVTFYKGHRTDENLQKILVGPYRTPILAIVLVFYAILALFGFIF